MAVPVLGFEAEILSDAPFDVVAARLREPRSLKCLRPFGPWMLAEAEDQLVLTWTRRRLGSQEHGELYLANHERGVHLRLKARHRGWMAFCSFGLLRWHSDRLLDRLVEEL
ncbi:hypothetical protein GETHLI_09000 [Geothrix limicola]|uniref:Uncharacterized protein n=1 Tax=Geothrix limicola TaxID=2927978 RepID=A0ABQ5QCK7_9BACT|nr:hypothetical protein [Geothrix limicola]GLH72398.1 hypothetical protein GETHLI_09000 [Geothrix limicola]